MIWIVNIDYDFLSDTWYIHSVMDTELYNIPKAQGNGSRYLNVKVMGLLRDYLYLCTLHTDMELLDWFT